ncbi:MAG: VWA domain-containing protein [Acidobacteria bacterium]|nr:VWA domain-containing protein [Acidobacteriota bacterium]
MVRIAAIGILLLTAVAVAQIRVDVDLVLINATVVDGQSRYVQGLRPEHFQIFEDKIEQKIEYFSTEDQPISVGIILDASGSMKESISSARDAAVTFLKVGGPEDEYFLVEFNSRAVLTEDFTTDISKLQSKIVFIPAKGMTALYDAVYLGLTKVKEGTNPKKALLLITDGGENRSRYSFSNIKEFAREQTAQIFAIMLRGGGFGSGGFSERFPGDGAPSGTVGELTELTGGQSFRTSSVEDLEDICNKIAIELKNQYLIGYRSTNTSRDGKWRKVTLKINPPRGIPRLYVRNKTGYFAPGT